MNRRKLLKIVSGVLLIPSVVNCSMENSKFVVPSKSDEQFRGYIKNKGKNLNNVTISEMVELVLSFYISKKAQGVENDPDSDMLLYQWGVFDWGQGENFEFDVTRQFIMSGALGDGEIVQLRCTGLFDPIDELRSIRVDNRWCDSCGNVEDFKKYIQSSEAYILLNNMKPKIINIDVGSV